LRPAVLCVVLLAVTTQGCWMVTPEDPPSPPVECGDGVKASIEECDNGPENSDTRPGACRTICALAGCGDFVIDPGEACDDGNRFGGDGCGVACRKIEQCGDGILDPGAEECDEGAENSDTRANQCRTNCKLPKCGDDVEDRGEECDDGNVVSGDSCDSNCTLPRCGNGIASGTEECDDGNSFNTDTCKQDCTRNSCSGGVDGAGSRCFVLRTLQVPDSDLRAVEIADMDGNGWADIVLADRDDDTLKIFWNNGGFFTLWETWVGQFPSFSGDDPVDVAIGDIDADGRLDVVTANETQDLLCLLENTGNRSFRQHFLKVEGQPTDVALAPVDASAGLEVLVGLDDADEVRVIRMNRFTPYGTPQALPASGPVSLGAGDLDGDGDADIAWSTGSPGIALNQGGTLEKSSVANSKSTSAVKVWNLDGAGPAELVIGVHGLFTSEYLRVYANSDTTNTSVFDSYVDVSVSEWPVHLARSGGEVVYADNGGHFAVLRNEQGSLSGERLFTYDGDAKGLAAGDLDNDGSPDVVIISKDKQAVLVFTGKSP
jgi:cysteine-rich repeat protein